MWNVAKISASGKYRYVRVKRIVLVCRVCVCGHTHFLLRHDNENSMARSFHLCNSFIVHWYGQTWNLMSRTAPSNKSTGWATNEIHISNFKFSGSYIKKPTWN